MSDAYRIIKDKIERDKLQHRRRQFVIEILFWLVVAAVLGLLLFVYCNTAQAAENIALLFLFCKTNC